MYYTLGIPHDKPTLGDLVNRGTPVFNDWWDTFIPEHRKVLEAKIIRRYYFDEIGYETPDQFVYRLNEHLARIMPYYNQLYESELIKFNPLLNHSITSNGRSIENLISKANTTDDKFAKSIRDFVGLTDRHGSESKSGSTVESGGSTTTENIGYGKSGEEHGKTSETAKGTEDETTHSDEVTKGTVDHTENVTGNVSGSKDSTTAGTETPGTTTTKTMKYGATETGKEVMEGSENTDGETGEKWTETLDDDSTTKVTTDLSESTTGSGDKGYSDTPQKELGSTEKIRKDYLTNYTWTDEQSKHDADTTVDTVYDDFQTRQRTGSGTSTTDTTKNTTTDTTKSKGGEDTETTVKSGSDSSKTTVNETTGEDSTKDTVGKDTTNKTVTTDGTTGTVSEEQTDGSNEKDWTEGGSEDRTSKLSRDLVTDSTGKTDSVSGEKSRENSDVTQTSVDTQEKKTEETTDKGTTEIASGFMNVSASALLEAFRRTFINVDEMIIEQLRDDFMVVF